MRKQVLTWGFTGMGNRPVGSGKTALMLALCLALRDEYSIAVVTNDIFTRWGSTLQSSLAPC